MILKRQLVLEVFPRGKNLFPKRNQLLTLMSQKTRESPRKSGNCLPRRSHSAVDLKRLLPARAAAPRKRKSSESYPRKVRMDIFLVGHNSTEAFPIEPNKNKNKFTRVIPCFIGYLNMGVGGTYGLDRAPMTASVKSWQVA